MMAAMQETPGQLRFRQQAEWAKQACVWLAWPAAADLWEDDLSGAQRAVVDFAQAIRQGGVDVKMLVANSSARRDAERQLATRKVPAKFFDLPYGDIWLRDIAPIFVRNPGGETAAVCFLFNGWGEKYVLEHDAQVGEKMAELSRHRTYRCSMIFEGGAIEPNGEGVALTTKQCLLNRNRNPGMSARDVNKVLRDYLGAEHIIWLERGLNFDHTDGHIDNIARFVSPEAVVCMRPAGAGASIDPQATVLESIENELRAARLPSGRALEVLTVPSPGLVADADNQPMAASYLNFLISDKTVSVPIYKTPYDDEALKAFERIFPGKKIIGIDCRQLLTGGGSLHCISQPEFT